MTEETRFVAIAMISLLAVITFCRLTGSIQAEGFVDLPCVVQGGRVEAA
jgi:hypothetical protein